MSIAAGPYKKLIPFINTEEVLLYPSRDDESLSVTIRLSNEVGRLSKKVIQFGNFAYLTHDRSEAMELCTDAEMLIQAIASLKDTNVSMLGLTAKDFRKKALSTGPEGSRQRVYSYQNTMQLNVDNKKELYLVIASFRDYKNRISIGNVTRETLLTKGTTPATSTIYRLEESVVGYGKEGTIWPGAVHRRGKDIMAGNVHVRAKHPTLRPQKVPNIKIKDMRILNLAWTRLPQYKTVATAVPFISPLEVSRNAVGIINGMFSFDLLRYIGVNSALSGIMTNNASLINSIELKDITIWKKKSGRNFKGNSLTPVAKVSCGISDISGFKKVASLSDGCEVLDTDNNGNEIIDVAYVDDTSKGASAGFMEYRMEILMADRSADTIAAMSSQLRFYTSKIQDGFSIPQPGPKYYNLPEMMINLYLDALEYLFGAQTFEPYTRSYWYNSLMALSYNLQNDIKQKEVVLRLVKGFVKSLNTLVQKTGVSSPGPVNHRSAIGMSKKETLLAFRHTFDNKLEIQGDANFGLGYIDDVIEDLDTVAPRISFDEYDSRATEETTKYNIADPQARNVNKYGFLSPAFMGLGPKKTIETGALQMSMDGFLPLARSRMSQTPVQDNKPKNDDALNKLEILQSQGVSIVPLKVSLKKEVIAPQIVNAPAVPAGNLLGRSSKFYIDNLKANSVSGSQRSIIRRTARKGLTKSPLIAKMVNKSITNFKPQKEVKNAGLLSGSIALTKTQEDPKIVDESDSMTAVTNYGSLVQVQYLAPYKESEGVKKQNWKLLDKNTFDNAKRDNKALTCRTVKVSNTVDGGSSVEMNPLSSLFTLGETNIKNVRAIPNPQIPRRPIPRETMAFLIKELGEEMLYSKNVSLPAPPRRRKRPKNRKGADPDMVEDIEMKNKYDESSTKMSKKEKSRSHRRNRSKGNLGY